MPSKKSVPPGRHIFLSDEEDEITRRNGIEYNMTLMEITYELEAIDQRRADLLSAVRDLYETYPSKD